MVMAKNRGSDWALKFLAALASGMGVEAAATTAEIAKQTAYVRRKRDREFARGWDDAVAKGSGKPRRPGDVALEALTAIAMDEAKPDAVRIRAAKEIRLTDRFGDRDEASAEMETPEAPAIDEATKAVLRQAEIAATATMLSSMTGMLHLNAAVDEWDAFATRDRDFQAACLAHARDPRPPLATAARPLGDGLDELLAAEAPAPASALAMVIDAMQAIVDGKTVDEVLAMLRERCTWGTQAGGGAA
jgi:hypothetical protein